MSQRTYRTYGGINISIVIIVILGLLLAGSGTLAIWLFGQYSEIKQTVSEQVEEAKNAAVNEKVKEVEAEYLEKSKQPFLAFTGPDEYGRVSFDYPRNWDLFVAADGLDNKAFEAYLNPGYVPPLKSGTGDISRFALRVKIEQTTVEKFLDDYKEAITKGTVKSSVVTLNKHDGTRLDGEIDKDIRGSIVVFKVDDNVLTIRTDAETFKGDFDTLIKTIDYK